MPKTSHFGLFWPLHKKMTKMACFGHKTSNFDQQPPKYHKTTSYFYDKEEKTRQKIWSHGTPSRSVGPLSFKRSIGIALLFISKLELLIRKTKCRQMQVLFISPRSWKKTTDLVPYNLLI